VTVRLFAAHADAAGASQTTVLVSPPVTVAAVKAAVAHAHPALAALGVERALMAINYTYAGNTEPVAPGDEVALIPPVAGG